jgi:type IX secretion system PorP/SprF family membrane protein
VIWLLVLCFSESRLFAQADISMASHWHNRSSYNPASIVRPDYLYFFTNARKQWTGLAGSPAVINLQASAYYEHLRSGFGLSLVNDNIGLTHVFNPTAIYAHRVAFSKNLYLALGLSGGVFVRSVNGSKFEAETILDPALNYANEISVNPDANFGFELQSKYFFLGMATTHLFSLRNDVKDFSNTNHQYGYVFYKNSDSPILNFSIGVHVANRFVAPELTIIEGHTLFRFKSPTGLQKGPRELFDIGVSYRSTQQLTLLLGMNITSDFRVGYAYDYDFVLPREKSGSHEIVLEFRIPLLKHNPCPGTDWYF